MKRQFPTTDHVEELAVAKATLDRSRNVAFMLQTEPLAYWFARLYAYITQYEIEFAEKSGQLSHPAFLLRFIPVFYDMYAKAAEKYSTRTLVKVASAVGSATAPAASGPFIRIAMEAMGALPETWAGYFAFVNGTITDSTILQTSDGIEYYAEMVSVSLVMGVNAHINGDMAEALVKTYRLLTDKYSGVPAFSSFHEDFFSKNRPVFDRSRLSIMSDIVNVGMGFGATGHAFNPNSSETVLGKTAIRLLNLGLSVERVYSWREQAWLSAQKQLGQR